MELSKARTESHTGDLATCLLLGGKDTFKKPFNMPNCCHISICQMNSVYWGKKHCSTPSLTSLTDIRQTRAHPCATAMSTGHLPTKLSLSLVHGRPRKSVSIIFCLLARHLKEQKSNMFSYKNIFMCTMPAFTKKSKIPSWEKPFKGQSFTMCLKNIPWSPEPLTCWKKPQTNYKIVTLGSFSTT